MLDADVRQPVQELNPRWCGTGQMRYLANYTFKVVTLVESIFCCSGWISHLWFGSGFGKFLLKIPIFSTSGWKKYLQVGLKRTHVKDESASHLQRSKVWRGQGPSRHQRHTKAGNICCFRATLPGGAWVPTLALRIMSTWSQQPHMLFYIIVTSFVFWLKPYSERLVPLNLCNLQYSVLCWSFTNGRSFMK